MPITAVTYHPVCLKHEPMGDHPENKHRLEYILTTLRNLNVSDIPILTPEKPAPINYVELVHSKEHIKKVFKICSRGGGYLNDFETFASSESCNAALYAISSIFHAIDLIEKNKIKNAFAAIRPPGHHATATKSQGFCIFNNVAIAARYVQKEYNAKKVMIVDIDAHHGNGTQEIFYTDPSVLYVGFHQDGRTLYPGTGFFDEIGAKRGLGFNVNIPMPPNAMDRHYMKALNKIVKPIAHQYSPDYLLVSAGFDAHFLDNISSLFLTSQGYGKIAAFLVDLAREVSDDKLVYILEGGYHPQGLAHSAVNSIFALANKPLPFNDPLPRKQNEEVDKYISSLLNKIVKLLSRFWSF